MRTDFHAIADGQKVKLFPNSDNPLHSHPVIALHTGGFYYCEGTPAHVGPDYYFRDVGQYNSGYEPV